MAIAPCSKVHYLGELESGVFGSGTPERTGTKPGSASTKRAPQLHKEILMLNVGLVGVSRYRRKMKAAFTSEDGMGNQGSKVATGSRRTQSAFQECGS